MNFSTALRLLRRHPLARGLDFLAIARGSLVVDIARGLQLPTLTGTLAPTFIPAGHALTFAGASANRLTWGTPSQNQWVNANDFTVSLLGVIAGSDFSAGSNSYPELLKFASSGSLIGVGFENVSGTVSANFLADSLTAVVGPVTLGSTLTNAGNSLGFSVPNRQALYTWRLIGTTLDFFIDGILTDTFTVTAHGAAVAAAISTANAGAGWSAAGKIKAWYVHNRALSAAEIAQLARNPWAVLQPQPTIFSRVKAAGGGGSFTTGDVSFTEQGDAVSASATLAIAANESFTEAGDAVGAAAAVAIAASESFTEASDTVAAAATLAIAAASSFAEGGDAVAGAGTLAIVANGAVTESDTIGSGGTVAIVANGGFTEQDDAVFATGTLGNGINADVAFTEQGDVVSASATLAIAAAAAFTEQGDTVVGSLTGLAPVSTVPPNLISLGGGQFGGRATRFHDENPRAARHPHAAIRNAEVLAIINAFLRDAA